MITRCGCTPGSEDTGWQEVRSAACLEAERLAWFGFAERVERSIWRRVWKSSLNRKPLR